MHPHKRFYLTLILFLSSIIYAQFIQAQETNNKSIDFGIAFQAYPTGIIPGLQVELTNGQKSAYILRVGYNLVRHRDLGKQDDERGGGVGFSLGYKRYFKPDFKKLFLAVKSDLWFNTVEWKNAIDMADESKGKTKVTVLQPTIEAGYAFELAKGTAIFAPTIALGAEINIKTKGEPVGEGLILLLGVNLMKRF